MSPEDKKGGQGDRQEAWSSNFIIDQLKKEQVVGILRDRLRIADLERRLFALEARVGKLDT